MNMGSYSAQRDWLSPRECTPKIIEGWLLSESGTRRMTAMCADESVMTIDRVDGVASF